MWYNRKDSKICEVLFVYVESIRLINFRNYSSLNVDFHKNLNIFLGKNAQGKTNLLESIYMCSSGKSFRTNKDREIINFEKDKSYIGAKVVRENTEKLIEIKLEREKAKTIRINKVELNKNRELYVGLNVVAFSPEDLSLIKGGPVERRNFLDNEISQIKPVYRYNLNRYNKILFQRNSLLKNIKGKEYNKYLLDVFDFQLAKIGTEIVLERIKFIRKLSDISKSIHRSITNGIEDLSLVYLSNVGMETGDKATIEKKFLENIKKNIKNDIFKGSTEIGPHRDDIEILINGINSRSFASQGQQRTAVLSMRLAEVELINEEKNEYPVLLLDDVLSELDSDRRRYLISTFKELQTIITSTDSIDIDEFAHLDKKVFYIEKGTVKQS